MPGSGEYRADRTKGITCVEDLPTAKVAARSRNYFRRSCPDYERSAYRHNIRKRMLHDLGDLVSERSCDKTARSPTRSESEGSRKSSAMMLQTRIC